jgi:hypothetical protein
MGTYSVRTRFAACQRRSSVVYRQGGSTVTENPGRERLLSLASHTDWPSVSIYLPLHRVGAEKAQDPIRLKNLVKRAQEQLVSSGMRAPDVTALLSDAVRLQSDTAFWRKPPAGLALFATTDGTEIVPVDAAVPTQLAVGDRFYLRPLFAVPPMPGTFYILAFSQNAARLFRAEGRTVTLLTLPKGTPGSLAEELKYDVAEESLQFQSRKSSKARGEGRGIAQYHGHGGEKDVHNEQIERFISKLDKGVVEEIGSGNTSPLVLAGVDYEVAAYRNLSHYPAIAAGQLDGNPDSATPAELHARALELLSPGHTTREADLAELAKRNGSPGASRDITQIVPAAAAGRVRTLFCDESVGPFGTFDPSTVEVEVTGPAVQRYLRESKAPEDRVAPADGAWDLADYAIAETLLHGGTVHAFVGEDPPVAGVAALLRY